MRTVKIFLLLIFIASLSPSKAISLKDAIKQNLIFVKIKGQKGLSSYYGKCIGIDIKNKTNKSLKIELSSGMFLMPEDSSIQRMMVAEEMIVALSPSASKKLTINAFCTQMSKSSPKNDLVFRVGKMAKGHLLEISQLISKHKFFTNAGQNAVWCITDENDINSIYSENENENKILREFVSKATGQSLNKVYYKKPRSSAQESRFSDSFTYPNRDGGTYSLIMFSEEGEEIVVFFKDRYIKPNYKTTQTYSLTYTLFPAGKYYFRLTKDNAEVIYNKEIVIRAAE